MVIVFLLCFNYCVLSVIGNRHQLPARIKACEEILTPYAYDVVRAQYYLSPLYNVLERQVGGDDRDDQDDFRTWEVAHQKKGAIARIKLSWTKGVLNDAIFNIEGGMDDEDYMVHLVEIDPVESKCSCQFMKSMGLPCRHIIAVHTHLQSLEMPKNVFNKFWMDTSDEQGLANLSRLLSAPVGGLLQGPSRPRAQLSRREREALCFGSVRAAINLALSSPEAFDRFMGDGGPLLLQSTLGKDVRPAKKTRRATTVVEGEITNNPVLVKPKGKNSRKVAPGGGVKGPNGNSRGKVKREVNKTAPSAT